MIFLIFLFLFFNATAFADWEHYAVEKPDGSIAVVGYNPGSNDTIQDVLNELGFSGFPIVSVTKNDLPQDRSDRKYWKKLGKKIVVDQDLKNSDLAKKQADDNRKKALLKMTDAEYQEAKALGLVK